MRKTEALPNSWTKNSVKSRLARLQRIARERADKEARRIPWPQLLEVRNQYIDWQEFSLWVRSIVETEKIIPGWLVQILDVRCPGFLEEGTKSRPVAIRKSLPLRLEDWIEGNLFAFARQEGWFNAIAYYAIRDPRYQRAEVCWAQCVEKWKRAKPIRYPTFEQWKNMAILCDSTSRLSSKERSLHSSAKKVNPEKLAQAVSRLIDWEAFAYWARPALENASEVPPEVAHELRQRCPGFLNELTKGRRRASESHSWDNLMNWIVNLFFDDARRGGWFDTVLSQVRNHPRAIRTIEYADRCDEMWDCRLPNPYPKFAEWGQAAYVETGRS